MFPTKHTFASCEPKGRAPKAKSTGHAASVSNILVSVNSQAENERNQRKRTQAEWYFSCANIDRVKKPKGDTEPMAGSKPRLTLSRYPVCYVLGASSPG